MTHTYFDFLNLKSGMVRKNGNGNTTVAPRNALRPLANASSTPSMPVPPGGNGVNDVLKQFGKCFGKYSRCVKEVSWTAKSTTCFSRICQQGFKSAQNARARWTWMTIVPSASFVGISDVVGAWSSPPTVCNVSNHHRWLWLQRSQCRTGLFLFLYRDLMPRKSQRARIPRIRDLEALGQGSMSRSQAVSPPIRELWLLPPPLPP